MYEKTKNVTINIFFKKCLVSIIGVTMEMRSEASFSRQPTWGEKLVSACSDRFIYTLNSLKHWKSSKKFF